MSSSILIMYNNLLPMWIYIPKYGKEVSNDFLCMISSLSTNREP